MFRYFAHGDEVHVEETTHEGGLLTSLTSQPTWLSLIIISFVLFGVYSLLEKLKVKQLNRILIMVPLLILIAILYMGQNPAVTTVVLVVGFTVTLLLALTLLRGQPKTDKPSDPKDTE